MPRLPRPFISLSTKLRVLLRQLGEMWPNEYIEIIVEQRCAGGMVEEKKSQLAALLCCEVADLRLDHDPPLGAREKVYDEHGVHVDYRPAGADPEYLNYRPHGPQFDNSHLIKTNVRGEHGQHPDRVLIKKNRRLERKEQERLGLRKPKPKVKMRSANRWAPKGARPLRGKGQKPWAK